MAARLVGSDLGGVFQGLHFSGEHAAEQLAGFENNHVANSIVKMPTVKHRDNDKTRLGGGEWMIPFSGGSGAPAGPAVAQFDLELRMSRPKLGWGERFEENQADYNRIRRRRSPSAGLCHHTLVRCAGCRAR